MFKESRLIGYTVAQIKAQQQKAGVKPAITGTSPHSAAINADVSGQTAGNTITANQNSPGAVHAPSGIATSPLDINTPGGTIGYDRGTYVPNANGDGVVLAGDPKQQLSDRLGAIDSNNPNLDVNAREAMKQTEIQKFNAEQSLLAQQQQTQQQNVQAETGALAQQSKKAPLTGAQMLNIGNARGDQRINGQQANIQSAIQAANPSSATTQQTQGTPTPQGQPTSSPTATGSITGSSTTGSTGSNTGNTTGQTPQAQDQTKQNGQQTTPDPNLAAIQAALAGTPYEFIGNVLAAVKTQTDQQQANAAALYGTSNMNLTNSQNDLASVINTAQQTLSMNLTGVSGLLKTTLDGQQQMADQAKIVQLKQNQDSKDQFDLQQNQLVRESQFQKTEMMKQKIIETALTGGSYDSAANDGVTLAEQQANQHISDLQQQMVLGDNQFKTQALNIDFQHTQAVQKASQDYANTLIQHMTDFADKSNALQMQGFTSRQALTDRQNQLNQDLFKNVADSQNTYAAALTKTSDSTMGAIAQQSRLQYDRQQATLTNLQTVWEQTGGGTNPAITAAVQAARAAGISEERIAPYASGQRTNQGFTDAYRQNAYTYMDQSHWTEPEQQSVMGLLGGVNFANDNERLSAYNAVGQSLNAGETDVAHNKVINYAIQHMDQTQRTQVQTGQNIIRQVDNLQQFVDDNKDTLQATGVYTKKFNDALKYAGASTDPVMQEFYARLTKINATEMHDLYGARLTETEIGFGNNFLGQSNEPLQNVIGKLGLIHKDLQGQIDQDVQTGLGITSPYSGGSQTTSQQNTSSATGNSWWQGMQQKYWNQPDSSQKKMNQSSTTQPSASLDNYVSSNGLRITQDFHGTYDEQKGYMKGEHGAYDLAPPEPGQRPPIPAYTAGKVVEVGTTGPYGNHFKVQDANGITWLYGHLSRLDVKQGQELTQGQQVGIMGDTGQADGVHLHLEAYKDGKPYDFAQAQQVAFNSPQ